MSSIGSLYQSIFVEKLPYWTFAISILGVASTSIGIECLTKCKCKGKKHDNLSYLNFMTALAVLGILLSGYGIVSGLLS